jgi:dCMP deaminase
VAYVPVVHKGIIEWVKREKAPILVLGQLFIDEFPQLKHDLRAVSPELIVEMLKSLGFQAGLLDLAILKSFKVFNRSATFVVPNDEVMLKFANRYLEGFKCEHQRVFIRWDKVNTTSDNEVNPNRLITSEQFTREIMSQCQARAELSSDWWRQIGAAAVRDGQVLVYGINQMRPTDYSAEIDGDIRQCFGFGERVEICGTIHAEAMVIATAASRGVPLAGVDFFCTTFPCPLCARLLEFAKVRRVIYEVGYSVGDAHDILQKAGIEVVKLVA